MKLAFLKEKKWGLPIWGWALLTVAFLAMIYFILKRRKNAATPASNATPLDAGQAAANQADQSGSGGGGSLGVPDSPNTPPFENIGSSTPFVDNTGTGIVDPVSAPATVAASPTTSPVKPAATATKSTTVDQSILVPKNATATSLQATVAKVGPSGVLVPKTALVKSQLAHPSAVKVTANKTGASANKAQGIFSIH